MQDTQIWFLSGEDPLEKELATHSSILAWETPWTEEPDSPRGGEELDTTSIGEGNGNPVQISCLKNPRDRGAWWAAVYGVAQSRARLKQLSSSSSFLICNVGILVASLKVGLLRRLKEVMSIC